MIGMHREIQYVQSSLVQLVDHEPDDAVITFGNHPDTIPLPQGPNKIVFGPGEFEAGPFDL